MHGCVCVLILRVLRIIHTPSKSAVLACRVCILKITHIAYCSHQKTGSIDTLPTTQYALSCISINTGARFLLRGFGLCAQVGSSVSLTCLRPVSDASSGVPRRVPVVSSSGPRRFLVMSLPGPVRDTSRPGHVPDRSSTCPLLPVPSIYAMGV